MQRTGNAAPAYGQALSEMADGERVAHEECDLIQRCLTGEAEDIATFQHRYGDLVYSYPIRVYRLPADEAGDFYVFAFEGGRIFRRAQTFAGRTPLRAYLAGFVLDNLVLEWKRGDRHLDTVSLEVLGDVAAADSDGVAPGSPRPSINEMLATLDVSKAVVLKLLYIEDCDLDRTDQRWLMKVSGRRLADVLAAVERLRQCVREREARQRHIEDGLDAAHAWIQLYERRLRVIADRLADLPPRHTETGRLTDERGELERKLERRRRQRATLVTRLHCRKVTAPYKEVAAVLNTTVGNVASLILRARQELSTKLPAAHWLAAVGDPHD